MGISFDTCFLGGIDRVGVDSWVWWWGLSNGVGLTSASRRAPMIRPIIRFWRSFSGAGAYGNLINANPNFGSPEFGSPECRPNSRIGSKLLVRELGYWPMNSCDVSNISMSYWWNQIYQRFLSRRLLLLLFLFAPRASFVILDFILLLFCLLFLLWLLLAKTGG